LAAPISAARIWGTVLVVLGSAAAGEALFLALLARQSGGGDALNELLVGSSLAGVLALAASLVFLRARLSSPLYGVVAAVLVYPLWYVVAIADCLVRGCE
jgi:hypothetical protein